MITSYIPSCVFLKLVTLLVPTSKIILFLSSLLMLIDVIHLRTKSTVQFLYSVQNPGGLTIDLTDH